ncbi:MAG TPA: hypothetical protein VGZ90_19640 [Puia sp.]|nr:hypothetical protein [Puia sp.]
MNAIRFYIWKDESIKNIQDKFSEIFPQFILKIFRRKDGSDYKKPSDIMFRNDVKMHEINPEFQDRSFMIKRNMAVPELEEIFNRKFGLEVQVSKRNGAPELKSSRVNSNFLKLTSQFESEGSPVSARAVYFEELPYGR